MNEIWADIKGFEGQYQISNLGRVKSLVAKLSKRYKNFGDRILKPTINRKRGGYFYVMLNGVGRRERKVGKKINAQVHRLVLAAFVKNPLGKECGNHKDGDKSNNLSENLEWCTRSENTLHGIKLGLIKPWENSKRFLAKKARQC